MLRLCVFCGSNAGTAPHFTDTADRLGRALAGRDVGLVYGGGDVGLMGVVADAVLDAGGEVTGVIPEFLERAEVEYGFVRPAHRMLLQRTVTVDEAIALAAGPVPETPHKWLDRDGAR